MKDMSFDLGVIVTAIEYLNSWNKIYHKSVK